MKTIMIYVLAALLVLGGSVGLYKQHTELTATKAQLHDQKLAIEALRTQQANISKAVARAARHASEARAEVSKALAAEPAFRDTAVPDGVRAGLCTRIRCSE